MSVHRSSLRMHFRRTAAAYLVLAISLVPTGVVYFRAAHNVKERDRARFDEMIRTVVSATVARLDTSLAVIRGAKGLFGAMPEVGSGEWNSYLTNSGLKAHLPRIMSLGFTLRVQAGETNQYLARMRAQGMPNHQLLISQARDEYFPVSFLYSSVEQAQALLGTDLSEDPKRSSAMRSARDSGRPVATGKLPLPVVSENSAGAGFEIYLPVYRRDEPLRTEAERAQALYGFVFASFSTSKLLEEIFGRKVKPAIDFEIFDGNELTAENLIYDADGVLNRDALSKERRLAQRTPFSAFGHTWTWCFSTISEFDNNWQRHMPLVPLAGGLVISGCLFGLALSQVKARSVLEGLTANLTCSENLLLKANQQLESKIKEAETAKEQLRAARDYAQNLIDSSLDLIISVDSERRICQFNHAAELAFGYAKQEVLGETVDLLYADNTQAEAIGSTIQKMSHYSGEVLNRRKDGTIFCSLLNASLLRDSNGEAIGVMGISRDFTDRKKVQEALAAEKERLAVTLRSIGDGVITTGTNGAVTLVNHAAEILTGWSLHEAFGRPLQEVFRILDEQTRERAETPAEKVLSSGEIFGQARDGVLIARDGAERLVSNNAAPMWDANGQLIGVVLVFRDITEKRRLEAELVKASKIESLGLLAGGIAHDFNNILTGILGNVSLAKMFSTQNKDVQERLGQAEKACLRARDLTQQLLTFAKGGVPIKKINSMVELVRESANFALRGSSVRCEHSHSGDLWTVEVDPGQISQVVHNIVMNASEAMPEGGIVSVQTENVLLNGDSPLALPSGKYVRTTIKDNGIGIRPEHLPRIFDPYFSTKQRGSGLGLATAYSIVMKHSGTITVQSQLGVGSQFDIYLPASDQPLVSTAPIRLTPQGKQGRVLIMDDEELILELAEVLLRQLGYDVVQAKDGHEAIECYRQAQATAQPFSAVIMDLTIPGGMGGKDAVRRLREIDPDVKAIVSSGYSNDPVMAKHREFGFSGVVIKPYQIEDLARALNQIAKT
jgi:PAS domain S-box-containing protein